MKGAGTLAATRLETTLTLAGSALILALAARLFWAVVAPLGPVGAWRATPTVAAQADPAFDAFYRLSSAAGPATVTALALKLYGVRLDQAMGRGSAIIATPDGMQSSFAVGDEVMPGVTLKAVAIDHAVLDRAGAEETLFIDQSVPVVAPGPLIAPTAPPAAPTAPATAVPTS